MPASPYLTLFLGFATVWLLTSFVTIGYRGYTIGVEQRGSIWFITVSLTPDLDWYCTKTRNCCPVQSRRCGKHVSWQR
jgi:hypothetical protein